MTNQDKKNVPDRNGLEILKNSGLFAKIIILNIEEIINQSNSADLGVGETIISDGIYMKGPRGFELYNCNYFIWSKPLIIGDIKSPYRSILAITPNVENDLHMISNIIETAQFARHCNQNVDLYPTIVTIT